MAKTKKSFGGSVIETIKTIIYALILAGIFRSLFFQPFWIPSGSMKDTLLIGDFLFVNKMAYGYSYASCPSIIIPRFGINVDAEDFVIKMIMKNEIHVTKTFKKVLKRAPNKFFKAILNNTKYSLLLFFYR